MKGLKLFLAACFAVLMLNGAVADNAKTTSRTGSNVSVRNQPTSVSGRNTNSVKQRNADISRTTTNKNVVQRNNTKTEKNRNDTQTRDSVVARTAKKQPVAKRATSTGTTARTARMGLSRSATNVTRESVMQRDFTKCKSIFFDCMDEFCANKDTQLKRCACSARANEFKSTQKSIDKVEDKLLDFSQRLLKVNMDPADAAVINQESAGEKAYNETKDKTASKKTLDEIAKKLNVDFDSAGSNNMSALSWSLDVDAAFDSVDSLKGASTTTKSGVALRNAALPICREMAAEVCDDNDISLVENSYNMLIEQDCNTVKRTYETQTQQQRNKVLESAALLDMTRLNTYQDNNSDDILTCKSKMLDMLTNTNVCGENLTKCLDVSGRYINPTTGEVFLSTDLINISTLITRPSSGDSWTKVPQNASFVSYLNSKKKYLETATKNCQSIANDVWNVFVEDALAQIKLAQNAKLEEVRQSCTTLLTECLSNANENLAEFDSRALSTFGVHADKTVNALCENVKSSCSVIIAYTPDPVIPVVSWEQGVTNITAQETYNKIINTCREIGRDCIINSCKSITGNFGLCESIHGSVNRHSILTRAACWNEVYNCVKAASDESINNIHAILPTSNYTPQNFYQHMYTNAIAQSNNTFATVYDICHDGENACTTDPDTNMDEPDVDCYRCRIAEQIWGNCKLKPDNSAENPILIPDDPDATTLLSWFAKNTHTQNDADSCAVSICPASTIEYTIGTSLMCVSPNDIMQCNGTNILCQTRINVTSAIKNCCPSGNTDQWGNCCVDGITNNITPFSQASISGTMQAITKMCAPTDDLQMELLYYGNGTYIFCGGGVSGGTAGTGASINCNGEYVVLKCSNGSCKYTNPTCGLTDSNNLCQSISHGYEINYFVNQTAYTTVAGNDVKQETDYCAALNNNICSIDNNGAWASGCDANGTPNHWLIDFRLH